LGELLEVEIYGDDYPTPDGTAVRDYIHVTDLAEAHVLALQRLLRGDRDCALNLGTGRGHSVREVIRTVENVSGRKINVRLKPGVKATRRSWSLEVLGLRNYWVGRHASLI